MPKNVRYEDLESGWCRHFWEKGNLTWTQAKLLKKGDWLLFLSSGGGYVKQAWLLGKFYGRGSHCGSEAVKVSIYPEAPSVFGFYHMNKLKLPHEDDMVNAHMWGKPLDESTRQFALEHGALASDVQTTLF